MPKFPCLKINLTLILQMNLAIICQKRKQKLIAFKNFCDPEQELLPVLRTGAETSLAKNPTNL